MIAQVTDEDRQRARACPMCNGWVYNGASWLRRRETSGLVCQRCGWDYGRDGEP